MKTPLSIIEMRAVGGETS